MRNHSLTALVAAGALCAGLTACSNGAGTASSSSTGSTGTATESTTAPESSSATDTAPGAEAAAETSSTSTGFSATTGGPGGAPSTPAKGLVTPAKVYQYEPGGAKPNPWTKNGAKSGIITSPDQVAGVVASLPTDAQAEARGILEAAAKTEAPSAQRPWYVFDGTGCTFTLRLDLVGGKPTPVMDPPKAKQDPCMASEWRMAVYSYDAAQAPQTPPAFTAPKA